MNADVFFTQGTTHKVCQDYALACWNQDQDEVAIAVCDGCSSADVRIAGQLVNHTDIGVRLLSRAFAKHAFQSHLGLDERFQRVLASANGFRSALSLERESLFATLLTAHVTYGGIEVHCVGDGVVALRERQSGSLHLHEISFPNGTPYYLQYEYEPESRKNYLKNCGPAKYCWNHYVVGKDGSVGTQNQTVIREIDLEHPGSDYLTFTMSADYDKYDLVALMSDGANNFLRKVDTPTSSGDERVPMPEVAKRLVVFKGCQGEFVFRRCFRAMREFQEMNWQPTDDVSVAAVYLPNLAEPALK